VDGDVAERAGLVFLRLIVERRRSRRPSGCGLGMTANAQKIDLILDEHARVGRTVGRMTDHAAFDFRFVLVYKRSLLFAMALVANLVARSVRAQLLGAKRAMRAMAIIALDQAFIDTVVERSRELRTHIHVARVTKFRRFRLHQELTFFGMVRRVAINAGDAVCCVHRAVIIPMLFGVLMAAQAPGSGLLWRYVLKGEDLGFVAPAIYVFFPRAMASLAAVPFHTFVRVEFGIHGGGEVSGGCEIRIDVFVAGLAGVGTHVECRIRRHDISLRLARRGGTGYEHKKGRETEDGVDLPGLHRTYRTLRSKPLGHMVGRRQYPDHCQTCSDETISVVGF
jgi:hypothetical protein